MLATSEHPVRREERGDAVPIKLMPPRTIRQNWDQSASVAWMLVTASGPTRSDLPHGLRPTPQDYQEHAEWRVAFRVHSALTKVWYSPREVFKGSPPLDEWWPGGRLPDRPGGFLSSVEKHWVPSVDDQLILFFRGDSNDSGKGFGEPLIWYPKLAEVQLLGEKAVQIDPIRGAFDGPWYDRDALLAELRELAAGVDTSAQQ